MSIFRPLLMLAIVVGACFLSNRHSVHHTVPMVTNEDGQSVMAEKSSVFTMLYMHVIPSALVPYHADHDHSDGDDADGDDAAAHAHDDGEHADGPIFQVGLPGFLGFFDGNPKKEGAQLVLYNLQIFQLAAILMMIIAMSGVPGYLRTGKGGYVTRLMGGFCQWLRDDLVEPAMGKELSAKLLPLMMYLF